MGFKSGTALGQMTPSPVIELNRAVAIAMSEGYQEGLSLINELAEQLKTYYLFHAARADLLRRLEQWDDAKNAYILALELCDNETEYQFLSRRLTEIDSYL